MVLPSLPPEPPAGAPADSESESGKRSRGAAVGGKTVEIPAMPTPPSWPRNAHPEELYVPDEDFDSTDLSEINRKLNRCRARIFRVTQQLRIAQREAAEADLTYRRQFRRALVQVTGSSSEMRKAIAELMCEEFETDLVVKAQVADEWKKMAMDARDDLKSVENEAHNVRAQIDVR